MAITLVADTSGPPEAGEQLPLVTKFTVGGRGIDIRPHIPFMATTWRKLRKYDIDPISLARSAQKGELGMEMLERVALAAFQLADPSITDVEMVKSLTFSQISNAATAVIRSEGEEVLDRPTSTASSL